MRLLAERDRAGAGEHEVSLVVPLVQVRRPFGDLRDVDVGDPAFAARHDALDVAEGAVDGRGFVTMANDWLFAGFGHCLSQERRFPSCGTTCQSAGTLKTASDLGYTIGHRRRIAIRYHIICPCHIVAFD